MTNERRQGKKCRTEKDERKKSDIKKEIVKIYKVHNPSKLDDVERLMKKHEGSEVSLLRAIQQKYDHHDSGTPGLASLSSEGRRQWQFNLKHYSSDKNAAKKQKQDWNIDASIPEIRPQLDDLASSIGGECACIVWNGKRKWVVREVVDRTKIDYCGQGRSMKLHDLESVNDTVKTMRELIHSRYQYARNKKSKASLMTNEHDRRKEEKRADQDKKKRRNRGKKSFCTFERWK